MGKKTLIGALILLALSIFFFEVTPIDIYLQDRLYDFSLKTWPYQGNEWHYFFFYRLIKVPIICVGLYSLYRLIMGKKKGLPFASYRAYLIIFLTLVLLPGSIALIGKKVTNVQCPSDVRRYGGEAPYVKLFEPYPPNPKTANREWPNGHCFPAGHASGGFALYSLFLLARTKKEKCWTLLFATTMGATMSIYQMLRGMHYLSHQLTTFFLAFIFISILNLTIKKDYE